MSQPTARALAGAVVLLAAGAGVVGIGPLTAARASGSCAPVDVPGGDWPTFGHDLANSRSQPLEDAIDVQAAPTLAPAWTFRASDTGGSGGFTGTPVVADGCVFVGSDAGYIYALNADTGDVVWNTTSPAGGVNATLAVSGGRVFGLMSRVGSPGVFALDEATGVLDWQASLDDQAGSDAYASPVVYGGYVFAGWSGSAAETATDDTQRAAFQGGYDIFDAATGALVHKQYTIHAPNDPADDLAGGSIWSTAAVDTDTGFLYVGTGNPFNPHNEDPKTNAIIKVDMRAASATFGQIVGWYHGTVDTYEQVNGLPCVDFPGNPPPWYPQGVGSCAQIDLDFGASPNIFTVNGKKYVGDGQKSGIYHAVDPDTMAKQWSTVLGPPAFVGGIVGTAAFDADTGSLYGPVTPGGYEWGVNASTGAPKWVTPTADGAHYGDQAAYAHGVVYSTDAAGFLDAFDAATGAIVLHLPVDAGSPGASLGAGPAVARHAVYAPAGGSVSAFRAGGTPVVRPPTAPTVGPLPADPVIVSGPGSQFTGYATPAVVVPQGNGATYVNGDAIAHDVQADGVFGSDTNPWCAPNGFALGHCPAFWTPVIGLGKSVPVQGVLGLTPGTYPFTCSIHPGMKGSLIVQ